MTRLPLLAATLLVGLAPPARADDKPAAGPLAFAMKDLDGKDLDLSKFKGKVVLFVNVASECGATPQYEGLQALYAKYEKAGLVVVGVPSNDFGMQEPGSNAEIKKFCTGRYKVTFPVLAKVPVSGKGKVPLYRHLTEKATNPASPGEVEWNFEKFLIGRDGKVAGRFKTDVEPTAPEFVKAVEAELNKK